MKRVIICMNIRWIWHVFFLVPLIWMDFVKDFHPGCVGKFPFVFRLAEGWEWVSLEGTALRWPLLSLVFFPSEDERSKKAWNPASVFLLCCLPTHTDRLWQDDGGAWVSLLTCRGTMRRGTRCMFVTIRDHCKLCVSTWNRVVGWITPLKHRPVISDNRPVQALVQSEAQVLFPD